MSTPHRSRHLRFALLPLDLAVISRSLAGHFVLHVAWQGVCPNLFVALREARRGVRWSAV